MTEDQRARTVQLAISGGSHYVRSAVPEAGDTWCGLKAKPNERLSIYSARMVGWTAEDGIGAVMLAVGGDSCDECQRSWELRYNQNMTTGNLTVDNVRLP